jgi:hypothetical protein
MPDPSKPKFSINLDALPESPAAPKEEGMISRLWKMYNQPVVDRIPGARQAIDKATEATSDANGFQHRLGKVLGLQLRAAGLDFLAPRTPEEENKLGAQAKGFVAGSTEAVSPALIAQGVSLGAGGAPAAIANAAIGLNGANNALDGSKSKLDRVMGAVDAVGGGAGALHGANQLRTGLKSASTASKLTKDAELAGDLKTQAGLRVALNDLKKAPGGARMTPELLAKHAAIDEHTLKTPGGEISQAIWGEGGRPSEPSILEVEKAAAEGEKVNNTIQKNRGAIDKATVKQLESDLKKMQKDAVDTEKTHRGMLDEQAAERRKVEIARANADTEQAARDAAADKATKDFEEAQKAQAMKAGLKEKGVTVTERHTDKESGVTGVRVFGKDKPPQGKQVDPGFLGGNGNGNGNGGGPKTPPAAPSLPKTPEVEEIFNAPCNRCYEAGL